MSQFLTAFLVALLTPMLIRWLMRSARKQQAVPDVAGIAFTMQPSLAQRRIALGSFVALLLGAVGIFYYAYSKGFWQLGAIFGGIFGALFVLPAALGVYSLRRRMRVLDSGLESLSPWTGRKFVPWQDIESVQFRKWGQTLRIKSRSGDLLVIPCSMSGTAALESRMREKLPVSVLGDAFEEYNAYLAAL